MGKQAKKITAVALQTGLWLTPQLAAFSATVDEPCSATASGTNAIAIGEAATASGTNATAIGTSSLANAINALAEGVGSIASASNALAIGTAGIGSIGVAALATGITFVAASVMGRRMSDSVGQALSGVVGLGILGLVIAMLVQIVGGIFAPGMFHGGMFELMIAGFGTVLFVGAAFVDFYTMPRTYSDDQYLAGALGMYLTYINLFIFILRLIIALNGGGRRD